MNKNMHMGKRSEMLADAGRSRLRIKEVEIGIRCDVDCSIVSPIKHGLGVPVMILKDLEFNRPVYYFIASGIVFGAGGLYIGTSFPQTFTIGGGLPFEPTTFMVVLTVIGTFLALTCILLHSMPAVTRKTEAI